MKNILCVKFPYSSAYGGGEHHTITLFGAIQKHGGRFYYAGSCSVLLREFTKKGWHARRWWAGKEPVSVGALVLFPFTFPFVFLGLCILLVWYRFTRGVRTLYCLSFTEKVVATPLARVLGMRVLWMEHVEPGRWLRNNPLRLFYTLWSNIAHTIFVSRDQQKRFLELGIPEKKSVVIHNGIDLSPHAEFKRGTFHWTKRFVLGTIARLEPEKGVAYLLQAFQTVQTIVPHARLIIVGHGSERKELEWLSRRLKIERSVQFVGFQKNLAGWAQSFDCFVLPSVKRESFGMVLLEAMAASCPVVASNLGGIPEVVQNNKSGILVEPGDAEMLARAIVYLYNHPDISMQLARNAKERVATEFTEEKMVQSFLTLFP